jgi:hypothetical protein
MIMGRATVPPGQPGRNGRAWARRGGEDRLSQKAESGGGAPEPEDGEREAGNA